MVSLCHFLLLVLVAEADGIHLPPRHTTLGFDREDWVTISDVTGSYKGEIYLEMTFFSSEPPSVERRPSKLPPQERLQHLKHPSKAPTAGGNLAVPGGSHVHGSSLPKNDKPLLPVQEFHGPAPFPSILRPGTGPARANGPESRPDVYTSPINSRPPPSLFPSRLPTSPVHQPNNGNPLNTPGQHPRPSPGSGYNSSYSPPHVGHSPPHVGHSPPHVGHSPPRLSHSPPRQPTLEPNPYVSDPVPPSNPASGFFPSPHIVVDSTPPDSTSWNAFRRVSNYSPPQPRQPSPPTSTYPGGPSFPSALPQHPLPFHPQQPTSSPYPPPQPNFSPPQPGYPQPQSPYPPPLQQGYPVQAPPQFPPHQSTYPPQHQDTSPTYGYTSPTSGPGQRPFFGRGDSIGELSDPALTQRYSSPLPLPNDTGPWRSSSPFPVPSVSPPHPSASPYSPSAEYERELQRKREQEERDAELARQLDFELNLRG